MSGVCTKSCEHPTTSTKTASISRHYLYLGFKKGGLVNLSELGVHTGFGCDFISLFDEVYINFDLCLQLSVTRVMIIYPS